jgi:hemerythrin-like domain-containing protein
MSAVITLLTQQHEEVLARIAAVEHADDAAVAAAFLAFLEGEVLPHFRLEEEALFPELAQDASIAAGPLRVMHAEHAAFRELLDTGQIARSAGDGPRLCAVAADLAALLRTHIAKEDGVLFPLALQRLSAEQLRRVDSALAAAS